MICFADHYHGADINDARVQVNVGSPAGSYASSSTPFFRYVVRLNEADLAFKPAERESLELLAAIPHAFFDDQGSEGPGWRVIAPATVQDWPVLETEPPALRVALETARTLLWRHAAAFGVTVPEIESVDEEIDKVLAVTDRAAESGYKISMTYVS